MPVRWRTSPPPSKPCSTHTLWWDVRPSRSCPPAPRSRTRPPSACGQAGWVRCSSCPSTPSAKPTTAGVSSDGRPLSTSSRTAVLLFCDPFTFPTAEFLRRLDESVPGLPVIGGNASGGRGPGGSRLLCGRRVTNGGAVGVLLGAAESRSSQSSRRAVAPTGSALTVTGFRRQRGLRAGRTTGHAVSRGAGPTGPRGRGRGRDRLERPLPRPAHRRADRRPRSRGLLGADRGRRRPVDRRHRPRRPRPARQHRALLRPRRRHRPPRAGRAPRAVARPMRPWPSCAPPGGHDSSTPDTGTRAPSSGRIGPVPVGGMFSAGEIGPVGGRSRSS